MGDEEQKRCVKCGSRAKRRKQQPCLDCGCELPARPAPRPCGDCGERAYRDSTYAKTWSVNGHAERKLRLLDQAEVLGLVAYRHDGAPAP